MAERRSRAVRSLAARCRLALVLAAAAASVAGCVGMPNSGSPGTVGASPRDTTPDSDFIVAIPAGPQKGWNPAEIVQGFLNASISYPGYQDIAREYLVSAPGKATWDPGWSVKVVDRVNVPNDAVYSQDRKTATVDVTGQVRASFNGSGQYVGAQEGHAGTQPGGAGDQLADQRFTLTKVNGEWRITNAPEFTFRMLNQDDFGKVYRAQDLYFFDSTDQVLVPDAVFVPAGTSPTSLVENLVSALLNNPQPQWLQSQSSQTPPAGTAFPAHTKILGGYSIIYDAIKAKHPEITVIGTVGPAPDGFDYEEGWKFANELNLEMVDEHGYREPQWFLDNLTHFDAYDRSKSLIYLGEYAAHEPDRANTLLSALAEAAYMTSLERNGDIVRLSSYAPLLGREDHTQWRPDLIYFTGTEILLTANYYVQLLFSINNGDVYLPHSISVSLGEEFDIEKTFATSCVKNSSSGDIILKLVNVSQKAVPTRIDLSTSGPIETTADCTVLTGDSKAVNSFENPGLVVPATSHLTVGETFAYEAPPYSLTVIRIKMR